MSYPDNKPQQTVAGCDRLGAYERGLCRHLWPKAKMANFSWAVGRMSVQPNLSGCIIIEMSKGQTWAYPD